MDQIVRHREGSQTMKERLEVSGQVHRSQGLPNGTVCCRKPARRTRSSGVTSSILSANLFFRIGIDDRCNVFHLCIVLQVYASSYVVRQRVVGYRNFLCVVVSICLRSCPATALLILLLCTSRYLPDFDLAQGFGNA